jgi:membrane-associated phospholipid phosphatase
LSTGYQPNFGPTPLNTPYNLLKKGIILTVLLSFCSFFGSAQVSLRPNREYAIAGSAFAWTGINYAFQFTSPKIPSGHTWNLGRIDAYAFKTLNKQAKTISDFTAVGTGLLAGLAIMNKDKNQYFKNVTVMAQSAWITANLAHSAKMIFKRNRPYTEAPGFQFSKRDDVYSFFSGHSALVASLVTSAILMGPGENASFKGQKIVLGAAGLTAATTVFLRIKAGKHYPSDVLTGVLVGMGIAWINYRIHEK